MLPERGYTLTRFLKKGTASLIGKRDELTLENRIFNAMCFLAFIIIAYNIPFSYFAGLNLSAFVFMALSFVLALTYYLARFKKKLQLSISIASILIIALLGFNYFLSAGIRGASLLSFTLTAFLILIVSPRKHFFLWASLCLATGLGLLAIEYHYPQSVSVTYQSEFQFFTDIASTYTINIISIFLGLYYLKNAFYKEKKMVEEKTLVLEKLNHEKTKLFSVLSHDLHNPLSSIQSYMEVIRDYEFSKEEKEMAERELSNAVYETQEMLYNILSWSKSQLNNEGARLRPYNLYDTLEPVITTQKAQAQQKKIRLTEEFDKSLMVISDINMLQFVARNIIGNAIKFTPPHGKIHVKAVRSGNKCILSIQDNGPGISTKQKSDIFSLKTQSTYGTNNEKGIGLGLYLCKEYTVAQHGKIWYENAPEGGAIFFISLSVQKKKEA